MRFSEALDALDSGEAVRRESWPAGVSIFKDAADIVSHPVVVLNEGAGIENSLYAVNNDDLFAGDWVVM